jgi:hypothetical protein
MLCLSTADQMWFQALVDRRAEAAVVNAMASGSQVSTMRAISHRIARLLSVSAPRVRRCTGLAPFRLDLVALGGLGAAFRL